MSARSNVLPEAVPPPLAPRLARALLSLGRLVLVVALAGGLAGAACSSDGGSSAAPSAAPSSRPANAGDDHAHGGAKAGAVDDWCAEHGVPESQCTRCNPQLIQAFRAIGDWCAEHGVPESQCRLCNPARAGGPTAEAPGDGAPPHGTKVRFRTAQAAAQAGIATAIAAERPGGARLEVIATIAYDATRRAEINARAPGVVRALRADLGAKLAAGAALAVIESAQVGEDRSRLDAANARVVAAEANHRREDEMFRRGVSAERDVELARQALAEARAARAAAASALGVVGAGRGGSTYTLTTPIAGTVVRRTATIGHMVAPDEALFEVVDTRAMWAELDIPEAQLAHVAADQRVAVTVENLPGRTFAGAIAHIAPEVDATTRTAKARVALDNPDGALRANMFARAEIALAGARTGVTVPAAAVQRAKGVALVFVRLAPDAYEARRVKLGLAQGEQVEVVDGVAPGEAVATRGSFLLKTETLKGEIGAGCCDVE